MLFKIILNLFEKMVALGEIYVKLSDPKLKWNLCVMCMGGGLAGRIRTQDSSTVALCWKLSKNHPPSLKFWGF